MDSSAFTPWTNRIQYNGRLISDSLYYYIFFYRISCILCKKVDGDQTPCSVASDLDLHNLPMSFNGTLGKQKKQKKKTNKKTVNSCVSIIVNTVAVLVN